MRTEDSEAIARRFIHVWSAGHLKLLDELADPEIEVSYAHFQEPLRGVDAYRAALEETFDHFPDLSIAPTTVIAQDELAAVEWVYEGTHSEGELFGVPASGVRVEVRGATVYQIHDDRVMEERGVVDVLGLMTQLGALPAS
jgi:steroid delta-isomerase-like uncharacterized protein